MRISAKLLLGFIPLAILTAMVAEVLYVNSQRIRESSQLVKEVYQNYSNILEMRKHEKNYLFYREKFYLYRIKDLSRQLESFLKSWARVSGEDRLLPRSVAHSEEVIGQYQKRVDQLLSSGEGPQADQILTEMAELGLQLEHLGEQMIQVAWTPIQVGTRKAQSGSIVFAVWAILTGAVLAFYLSHLLVKPIQQLVGGTRKVAEGDLSQRVQVHSRDEFGELADSFNRMVLSLEQGQTRLEQKTQELTETKETLENIVQSSVDAIVATDPKGCITFVNRSMQEMILGKADPAGTLLGVPMAQLYAGGLPEARRIMDILRDHGRLVNYETTMIRNGRVIPILTSASLLKDEKGKVIGTLGVIKDLTEQKKLEEDLQKAQAELGQKEKLAAIGRLAAGVAHEMNDPLTSILTFSNLLREETREGDANRESLDIVIKEATRARRIVSDLLSFSREAKPALEWVDLSDLLDQSLLLLEKQGALERVEMEKDLARELPLVMADSGQMHQVFTNILLNSIQAMTPEKDEEKEAPLRGKKLVLRTRFCETLEESWANSTDLLGPFIRVVIADNGRGIPPEDLDKIFDPFFTTKRPGEGTGLGLYIASGILKNYGAHYRLESKEGQGTTFTIDFPLSASGKA
jgi:two-component system, NtrC family, sensor kinase